MRRLIPQLLACLVAVLALGACGAGDGQPGAAPATAGCERFHTTRWVRLEDRARAAREREVDLLMACVRARAGRAVRAQRQAYVDAARWIADWGRARVARGEHVVRVARDVVVARNTLKAVVRRLGPAHLRMLAEERNRRRYGNPLGPRYADLVRAGKTPAQIIAGAGETNRELNELLGVR